MAPCSEYFTSSLKPILDPSSARERPADGTFAEWAAAQSDGRPAALAGVAVAREPAEAAA